MTSSGGVASNGAAQDAPAQDAELMPAMEESPAVDGPTPVVPIAATPTPATPELTATAERTATPVTTATSESEANLTLEEPLIGNAWSAPFALIPPGFGVGHFLGGERQTGRRLLGAGLGGATLFFSSGIGLLVTGASRHTIAPIAWLAMAGFSAFLFSTLADLTGSIARGRLRGRPMRRPKLELSAGFLYVEDAQFDYGPFLHLGSRFRSGANEIAVRADLALNHNNQRVRADYRYRFAGRDFRASAAYVRFRLGFHHFGNEGFRHLSGELAIGGRYELSRLGRSLRGTFVDGEIGLGLQGFGFDAFGGGLGGGFNGLLLFHSAYGFYLARKGELAIFYDHRRDGFAGALGLDSVAAGTPGHFGVRGEGFFREGDWGIRAEARIGSAYVFNLNLVWRQR